MRYLHRTDLPANAVEINGAFIEDALDGFMTVGSSGREILTRDLEYKQYSARSGGYVTNNRWPIREIKVDFVLGNVNDWHSSMEKLNQLCMTDDYVEVRFNDDYDNFYRGYIKVEQPSTLKGSFLASSYKIVCEDPFKYAVAETTITGVTSGNTTTFTFDNDGTYPSPMRLYAEFAGAKVNGLWNEDGDCGYVAFMDNHENILQFGNPETAATAPTTRDSVFINRADMTSNSGFDTLTITPEHPLGGSVSFNQNFTDSEYNSGAGKTWKVATPNSYGSGVSWHGPALQVDMIPSGSVGTLNFEASGQLHFCSPTPSSRGALRFDFWGANNTKLFTAEVVKAGTQTTYVNAINTSTSSQNTFDCSDINATVGKTKKYTVQLSYWGVVGSHTVYTYYTNKKKTKKSKNNKKTKYYKTKVVTDYGNIYYYENRYVHPNLTYKIKRTGGDLEVNVGGVKVTAKGSSSTPIVAMTIQWLAYGNYSTPTISLDSLCLKSLSQQTISDTCFMAGDTLIADTNDASIYLIKNGQIYDEYNQPTPELGLGALGNDWEDFVARPGSNTIVASWSNWVDSNYKPTVYLKYNKAWL